MKRALLFSKWRVPLLLSASMALIAATYGLVRFAYGLFLPDVQAELSFGAATAGLVSSGASAAYCLAAIISFFAGAAQPRLLVAAAGLAAGMSAAGMAWSADVTPFAVFAITGSTGAGLASPALVSIVARNVSAAALTRSQAIVNAGTGPGLVAAGILALLLLPDWRLSWTLIAAFTVAVAAAVLLLDRARGGAESPALPSRSWFRDHRRIIVATLLMGVGSAAVWTFGRTHLVDAGASDAASVIAWICLGLGGAAVIGTAHPMARLQPRTAWAITTGGVAAASVTLGLLPDVTATAFVMMALAACAVFGWGYTAGTGALIAWTTQIDPGRAPAGTSMLFVMLVLGQALGAAGIGALIAATNSPLAFGCAAAITLAAVLVSFRP